MVLLPVLAMVATPAPIMVPPPIVRTPPVIRVMPPVARAPTPGEALARGMVSLTPAEAVAKAAEARDTGVLAVVPFKVGKAAMVGGRLFLNSEADYRDPRNLSVVVAPSVLPALRAKWGAALEPYLLGASMRVVGKARTVRIDLTEDGRPTGKYYFQTHLAVTSARQLELAEH